MLRRIADEPLADRIVSMLLFVFLAVLQRYFRLEHLSRFVHEQNTERAVIDDAPRENRQCG